MRETPHMMTNIGRFNSLQRDRHQHSTPHTNRFCPPTTRVSTLKTPNLVWSNVTWEETNMAEYLVSKVSYLVHPLRSQFRSNSSPHQFNYGLFYRTHCINTRVVNKLVLHLWDPTHLILHIYPRLSSVFPLHSRISDRKYWTCLVFIFISPPQSSSELNGGRVKSLITHLTPQEDLARSSWEPSDNRALADPKSARLSCVHFSNHRFPTLAKL